LGRRDLGWASVATGVLSIIDAPGAHISMLDTPHIYSVAEKITGWLSNERS
jgi:thioesterase domain-containing protein